MIKKTTQRLLGMLPTRARQTLHARHQAQKDHRVRRALAQVGAEGVAVTDINHLLHHLRGQALAELPKDARHFVSVGCAGTWYFNWIQEMCRPQHHTGIEFFTPRPDDLPANVDWIVNTAGNMEAIPDATADLLFSGQNLEHLWPEDVGNFLLESHRVLERNGLLVIDSPNRLITSRLGWSHPEHTIEYTSAEIEELANLAGFDVVRRLGLWLCEDPQSGEILPFADLVPDGAWSLGRRAAEARNRLESSFIWWIEARRSDRTPDSARLRERISQIFQHAWPERLNRFQSSIGRTVTRDGELWVDSEGRGGALLFGPYTALPTGRHTVRFTLEYATRPESPAAVHVSAGYGGDVVALCEIPVDGSKPGVPFEVSLDFELPGTTFSVQFVVAAAENSRLLAKKAVTLRTA